MKQLRATLGMALLLSLAARGGRRPGRQAARRRRGRSDAAARGPGAGRGHHQERRPRRQPPSPSPGCAPPAAAPQTAGAAAPAQVRPKARRQERAAKGASAGKTPGKKGTDRLELEATDVTGNSELPKVLYIVPWKPSELGDMAGRPVNSLLDEVLQPLDRDVFKRENRYYEALKPDAAAAKSDAAQGSGG